MINQIKYINQFCLLIIVPLLFSACIPIKTPLTPKVTGSVFDARTKTPIANAYIHYADSSGSSYSSSTGAYELAPIDGEKLVGILVYNNEEDIGSIIVDAQGYRPHIEKILRSQQSKRAIKKDIYLMPESISKTQVSKIASANAVLHCPVIQDIKREKTIYKGKYRLTATTTYPGKTTKWIGDNLYTVGNPKVIQLLQERHAGCNNGICNTTCLYQIQFGNSYIRSAVLLKNL